jgi:hypothetical protein
VAVLLLALVGFGVVPMPTGTPCLSPYNSISNNGSTYMVFANGNSSFKVPLHHSYGPWAEPCACPCPWLNATGPHGINTSINPSMGPYSVTAGQGRLMKSSGADSTATAAASMVLPQGDSRTGVPSSAGTVAGLKFGSASAKAPAAAALTPAAAQAFAAAPAPAADDVLVNASRPAAAAAQARCSPAFVPLLPQCLPAGSNSSASAAGMNCSCSNGTAHVASVGLDSHLEEFLQAADLQQAEDMLMDQQQDVSAGGDVSADGQQQRPVCSLAKRQFAGLTGLVVLLAAVSCRAQMVGYSCR